MREQPDQRRSLLYYTGIALIVILLLNIFVFPSMLQQQVKEVSYDEFISMVKAGKVAEVAYEDNQLVFIASGDNYRASYYKTGVWPGDTELKDLLLQYGVRFSAEIPTQASPLLSFLISFVAPVAFFAIVGRLLMRSMQKRVGGANALTLGKANAKIYIEAQTGKTF